jgi:uncharacterized membrane protein
VSGINAAERSSNGQAALPRHTPEQSMSNPVADDRKADSRPDSGGCALRSTRERIVQCLCFQAGVLLLIAPLFSIVTGFGVTQSLGLILGLSIVEALWAGGFNTLYDRGELRWTGWVASDRPHRWRIVHALAFEASQVVVTCPIIYFVTGLGWLEALAADLALTVAYTVYGYLFHLVYDRLRPVRLTGRAPVRLSAT